jgi:bifunctional non-homologous end joining protein LigD
MLNQTFQQLKKLQQDKAPTDVAPPSREIRNARWVKPTLVAEVNFTGWTRDGVLRHPAFIAFRSDKPAKQIVREVPIHPKSVEQLNARKRAIKPDVPASTAGITLSHPDKVLYPDTGTTKRDLADYYNQVKEWMLPHVIDRPLALVRCPNGLATKCFFQRNWTQTLSAAIDKVDVGGGKKDEVHMTIHDLSGVMAMVQMGVLEIHTWGCSADDIEHPDQLIFDLDPGPDVSWKQVVHAANIVNETLQSLKLPTFLKTSGGKGLHITIPLKPTVDWDSAKSFCQTIAKSLADESDLFVANMRKDLRGGKVYIDYNRNGRSATAVAPYSTRARPGAAVAMPLSWEELPKLSSADQFKLAAIEKYLNKRKNDPWRDFNKSRVDLYKVIATKSAA